jgi:hypothetical protein
MIGKKQLEGKLYQDSQQAHDIWKISQEQITESGGQTYRETGLT